MKSPRSAVRPEHPTGAHTTAQGVGNAAGLIQPSGRIITAPTTKIVSATGADCGVACRRKVGAALETRDTTNFPAGEQCTLHAFLTAEEGNVIVVSGYEDVPSIKSCRTIVVMTIEGILAGV